MFGELFWDEIENTKGTNIVASFRTKGGASIVSNVWLSLNIWLLSERIQVCLLCHGISSLSLYLVSRKFRPNVLVLYGRKE